MEDSGEYSVCSRCRPAGRYASNELTEIFIEEYGKLDLPFTKIHLLCRRDISRSVLKKAFTCVRAGKNSIMFMSDEKIIESLTKLGEDEADARDYHVVGCYECGGRGELTCSCNARVNLPKALEYAIFGGVDVQSGEWLGLENDGCFSDFDSLFDEYLRQVRYLSDGAIAATENYEREYPKNFALHRYVSI